MSGPGLRGNVQQVQLGAAQIHRAHDRGGLAQPQLADDTAAGPQGGSPGVRQPGVGQIELVGNPRAAQVDPPVRAQPHGPQIGADRQRLGVQRGAARRVQFGVVEVQLPAEGRAVQPDLAVGDETDGPHIGADLGVVELEGRFRGGLRRAGIPVRGVRVRWHAEPRPVQEDGARDLRALEPHLPGDTAAAEPQHPLHPHGARGESGQHRVAQHQVAQPRPVQVRVLLEVAEPQPYGVVDRPVGEVQPSGDARPAQPQAGYLTVLDGSADQQRPQHLGAHGPLRSPGGPVRGVLVGALAEVDALAAWEGVPDPALRGRQVGGDHRSPAAASARATPGSLCPRNRGSGSNTTSSRALPAANTSRAPP